MERAWFEYEIIETIYFHRELEKLCNSEDEQNELIEYVVKNRSHGVGIGKTGLKKIRVALSGKGKRGGGLSFITTLIKMMMLSFFSCWYTVNQRKKILILMRRSF